MRKTKKLNIFGGKTKDYVLTKNSNFCVKVWQTKAGIFKGNIQILCIFPNKNGKKHTATTTYVIRRTTYRTFLFSTFTIKATYKDFVTTTMGSLMSRRPFFKKAIIWFPAKKQQNRKYFHHFPHLLWKPEKTPILGTAIHRYFLNITQS